MAQRIKGFLNVDIRNAYVELLLDDSSLSTSSSSGGSPPPPGPPPNRFPPSPSNPSTAFPSPPPGPSGGPGPGTSGAFARQQSSSAPSSGTSRGGGGGTCPPPQTGFGPPGVGTRSKSASGGIGSSCDCYDCGCEQREMTAVQPPQAGATYVVSPNARGSAGADLYSGSGSGSTAPTVFGPPVLASTPINDAVNRYPPQGYGKMISPINTTMNQSSTGQSASTSYQSPSTAYQTQSTGYPSPTMTNYDTSQNTTMSTQQRPSYEYSGESYEGSYRNRDNLLGMRRLNFDNASPGSPSQGNSGSNRTGTGTGYSTTTTGYDPSSSYLYDTTTTTTTDTSGSSGTEYVVTARGPEAQVMTRIAEILDSLVGDLRANGIELRNVNNSTDTSGSSYTYGSGSSYLQRPAFVPPSSGSGAYDSSYGASNTCSTYPPNSAQSQGASNYTGTPGGRGNRLI